jgi:parvulin-like peptidyl-prolyl cis-trans isomerase-like protein
MLAVVCAAEPEDALVRVNGQTVTRADLRLEDVPGEMAGALRVRTARALVVAIDRRLLLDEALKAFVGADGADALLEELGKTEMTQLSDRLGSRLKARRYLAERGVTVEQYKRARAEQLLVAKFLSDTVLAAVNVPPAHIRRYYDEHPDEFRLPDRIAYRQIVLVSTSEADKKRRRAEAEDLLKQLKAGADFGKLADQHSDERAKPRGGLRIVPVPVVIPPAAHPGQGVVLTYHQIRFDAPDAARKDQVQELAAQVLVDLQNGADFEELAAKHSSDADTHPGGRRVVELDAASADWRPPVLKGVAEGKLSGVVQLSLLTFGIARLDSVKPQTGAVVAPVPVEPTLWRPPILKGLKAGETTGVVERGYLLVIARLDSIKRAAPAPFETAQAIIRQKLRGSLQQAALDRYTLRLRGTAHVEYLPAGATFKP